MSTKTTVLAVGTYHDLDDADADADRVMQLHHSGALGHVATGIVTRGSTGVLEIHRRDTSARHLAIGGAMLGAALGILAPPLGAVALAGYAGVAATTAVIDATVLAGLGGATGHLWHAIPKSDIRELGDMIDGCETALVVVAVDKSQTDLAQAMTSAARLETRRVSDGDIESAYEAAAQAATGSEG